MTATAAISRGLLMVGLLFSLSCGRAKPAGGARPDGGNATIDAATIDMGGSTVDSGGSDGGRVTCLERPDELPRPPTGALPCELIPPGVTL